MSHHQLNIPAIIKKSKETAEVQCMGKFGTEYFLMEGSFCANIIKFTARYDEQSAYSRCMANLDSTSLGILCCRIPTFFTSPCNLLKSGVFFRLLHSCQTLLLQFFFQLHLPADILFLYSFPLFFQLPAQTKKIKHN